MYSHHGESEPQKQRVSGPAEPVLLCPEDTFHEEPQEDLTLDLETSPDVSDLQCAAATFILKVQETQHLPQSTMDMILKEIDSLYQVRRLDIDLCFST